MGITKKLVVSGMIGILVLVGIGYAIFKYYEVKPMVTVGGYYDYYGNPIQLMAIVNGVEGVKYITLKIEVKNNDKVPLDLEIDSITPTEIADIKPTNMLTVDVGKTASWTTGLIDVEPYEGGKKEFCATVRSKEKPALRRETIKKGCVSIDIYPNPSGAFDITIMSSSDSSPINPGCTEDWSCGVWGSCVNGQQTRTCTDANNCGTTANKPSETQVCEIIFRTNAVNGVYKKSGVWIDFGYGTYVYKGYSSFRCTSSLSATGEITKTPEGYPICAGKGYDATVRVYLEYRGDGLIFEPTK